MADEHARDEVLAQLRREVAALRAEVDRPRRRLPRRFLTLALAALLVALVPLATLAASPFNDLTGGVHDNNIQAIYDAGITKGCVPNVSYCPTDTVTRQEMASFLARTAGLGDNPPVANAKTAQTATNATHATSADTAANATNAGNANTVGNYAPNGLVQIFGAANSANVTGGEVPVPPSSQQTINTVTFNAPAAGYVALTASVGFFPGASGCPCTLGFYTHLGTDSTLTRQNSSPVMVETLMNNTYTTGAVTWNFPVTAGANTFSLIVFRTDASTSTFRARPAVTGIYTPFGTRATIP